MDETNALATTSPDSMALYQAALEGMGDYIPKISNLRLIQPIEIPDLPAGTVAGRFLDAKSNEQFETMQIIPLEFRAGRVMFPPGSDRGADPLCRSNDGKKPVCGDDRLVPQDGGKGCAGCQWSKWAQIKGKKIKPACTETMSLLFLDEETLFPYRVNLKSSNLVPGKDYKETLFKQVMKTKMKGNLTPHFGFTSTLSATKIVGKKGTYYVVNFTPPKVSGNAAEIFPLYEKLVLRKGVEEPEVAQVDDAINNVVEGDYVQA